MCRPQSAWSIRSDMDTSGGLLAVMPAQEGGLLRVLPMPPGLEDDGAARQAARSKAAAMTICILTELKSTCSLTGLNSASRSLDFRVSGRWAVKTIRSVGLSFRRSGTVSRIRTSSWLIGWDRRAHAEHSLYRRCLRLFAASTPI